MKKIGKNMLTIYKKVIYATIPLTTLKFAKKRDSKKRIFLYYALNYKQQRGN